MFLLFVNSLIVRLLDTRNWLNVFCILEILTTKNLGEGTISYKTAPIIEACAQAVAGTRINHISAGLRAKGLKI